MALFNLHFDRPGPGVSPDAPRKKGPARFFEMLGRDFVSFYLAGMLALASAMPFVLGVWFAVDTHSLVPLLLAGVHLAFAFPMIRRLLELFSLYNVGLFVTTTLVSFGAFALLYTVVYRLTAKAYYSIVSA